ncbi:2'-deoxycytidine 5'-triphosphate deaminase [Agaricicola taiwanensis]|nr:2'-deoxycytidine 5'-triphosphate deaminase [Agaricicola taiwanensis]
MTDGILPGQAIAKLVDDGVIRLERPLADRQIQPASLDLRLGTRAYRMRASFLPGQGRTVESRVDDLKLHEIDLTEGAVLETGCVYLVPLLEHLDLPHGLAALTNPKSSTGRLDVFTRVIADGGRAFDSVPDGYTGALWAEVSPRTFPVLVRTGSRLTQLRFRQGHAILTAEETAALQASDRLVDTNEPDLRDGISVTIDLAGLGPDGLVGYRAKRHTGVIDVDRVAGYAVDDFWEAVHVKKRQLVLDPGEFYILASNEAVHVPPGYAAEMVPFDPLVGEFRVHYAGFFDPGFGHTASGGHGSRAVLEVRSHEVPFIVEHGQTVGRLVYERLNAPSETLYGETLGSNYQAQKLKLSKHFRAD